MKKTTFIFILVLFNITILRSQVSYLTRIKIVKDDTTFIINNLDTSYIFNAFILTHAINGVSNLSLTCQNYDNQSSSWLTNKDTSYIWNNVTSTQSANQVFEIFKPNDNLIVICLGRLYKGTRKKYTFNITGVNGILTREFDF